jgi:flagellar motor switch protein FliN
MAEEEAQDEQEQAEGQGGEDAAEDMEAFEDAVGGDEEEAAGEETAEAATGAAGEAGLDPLAEEMLKLMEEDQQGAAAGGQEEVDQMMEMEMLKAMQQEGGAGAAGLGAAGAGGLAVAAGGRAAAGGGIPPNVARLMDVPLTVTIELGRARKVIAEVMEMGEQSLLELNKAVGEPVDVMVNGRLFARGEVVTVSENFGVRITELVAPLSQL